ncbi:MAG: Serine/threonine-protein kinase PknD [bacterium]|nr:Serine/threonine-protein kinase PknD [bacterium]
MIGQTISHYKIIEQLGGSGLSAVYKAEDLKLKRIVALRFVPPEFTRAPEVKALFIHEAQAASALDHRNICSVHEFSETADGRLFIVIAYYDGERLKKKVARGQLSVDSAIDIAMQIAQGLAKVHENGLVHGDIKPGSVMITKDGVIKILDFGLAKLGDQGGLARAGTAIRTVAYMSPEQAQGEAVDHRTDIWSLGVMLYEMLTGQLPFKGDYEQAVVYSILNETPRPATSLRANVPQELESIINKCLAKKATDRYQQINELLLDLRALQTPPASRARQRPFAPDSQRRRRLVWYAAGLVVLALVIWIFLLQRDAGPTDRKSIAVLPFVNLGTSHEDEYFSDGITEDVITELAKIADLKVISRTSVMKYKGVYRSIRDIGRELDVATVLEGSVRRSGKQVRVAAQLIDAHDEGHLWAEVYDEEMTEIFAIQSDIARQIAGALKARLSSAESGQAAKKPTTDITAYEFYLKGREYYYRHDRKSYEMAGSLFVKALEQDSGYALAYAGLADACAQRDLLDSAIVLSQRAITLDPNLAEGYKALGLAYYYKGWLHKSLEASMHAIKLNANHFPATVNVGWVLLETDPVAALPWLKKAFVLAPTSASAASALGVAYMSLADKVNAEKWFQKSVELAPDYLRSYQRLWQLYLEEGQSQAAEIIRRKILAVAPNYFQVLCLSPLLQQDYQQAMSCFDKTIAGNPAFQSLELAYVYLKTGRENEAGKMFDRFAANCQARIAAGNERGWPRYDLARIHAARHQKAEFYHWLEQAIAAGWLEYRWALIDPLLENVRTEARFQEMMAQVAAKIDQMRRRAQLAEEKK